MDVMYRNFVGEVAKLGIKKYAIAKEAKMCTRTLREKIVGKREFTLSEAIAIRNAFFPNQTLEYLFSRDNGKE